MPKIRVHSYDFEPALPAGLPDAETDVELSLDELRAAIVTVGKSRADDMRRPDAVLENWQEIRWRESLLTMALSVSDGFFVQSDSYRRLDPSEKVGVSYMLGLTATNALCTKYLDMPFLMHLDVYASMPDGVAGPVPYDVTSEWLDSLRTAGGLSYASDSAQLGELVSSAGKSLTPTVPAKDYKKQPAVQRDVCSRVFGAAYTGAPARDDKDARFWSFLSRLARNARPDLFGVEMNAVGDLIRCVIGEAKGRSTDVGSDDSKDCRPCPDVPKPPAKLNRTHGGAMLQALSRSHVNGVRVGRHLAVFAYFDKHGEDRAQEVWHFSWKDPVHDEMTPEERTKVPLGPLVADYYSSLLALGCVSEAISAKASEPVDLSKCPIRYQVAGSNFTVEFHSELYALLVEAFRQSPGQEAFVTEKIPSVLRRLEHDHLVGSGTTFGINGVSITGNMQQQPVSEDLKKSDPADEKRQPGK